MPARQLFPAQANGRFVKLQDLRYGENPHQRAAFYRDLYPAPGSLVTAKQLQGKELSYNNIADADAAWECVKSFQEVGLRDRQARQPLRRGRGQGRRWRPTARPSRPTRPLRSAASSPSTAPRRRRGPAGQQAVRRGADGARLHARGAGSLQVQGQRARAADRAAPRRRHRLGQRPQRHGHQAHRLRPADADRRQPRAGAGRPEGGDEGCSRPPRNCRTCCSPGRWPSTSRATPSCSARAA